MDEYTKCLIYRRCFDAFHGDVRLLGDAVKAVYDRLSDMDERECALAELKVITIDALFEDASSRFRDGGDMDALTSAAVGRMSTERIAQLAAFAIAPSKVLQ